MNAAEAQVCHATPERTRLVVPAHRRDRAYLTRLCQTLSQWEGVDAVRANPTTGSVVISHKKGLKADLNALGGMNSDTPLRIQEQPPREPLAQQYNRLFQQSLSSLDRNLRDLSDGSLDFASVAGAALVGLGINQMRRGMFLPAGLTLMVLAYRLANGKVIKDADAPTTT